MSNRPGVGRPDNRRFAKFFVLCFWFSQSCLAIDDKAILANAGTSVVVSTWRPMLGVSMRQGEASHPGPPSQPCSIISFCITNPTCIARKSDTFRDLFKATQADVITCSETAATDCVQRSFSQEMKTVAKVHWSPPVMSLSTSESGHQSQRGRASGVALLSKVPSRPARLKLPEEWTACTRFVHCIVQIGQSHCQVIVLYCKPTSVPGAVDYNSDLMTMAIQQAALVPLPYIILGDLNMKVEQFNSWELMASRGCRSLDQIYQRLYAKQMPNTCRDATRIDNAILSPGLVPLVEQTEVLENTWLATHRPVFFQIKIPGQTLFACHLKFPKSFVDLDIPDDAWSEMQDFTGQLAAAKTIPEWGQAVESNVNAMLSKGGASRLNLSSVPYCPQCVGPQEATNLQRKS